MISSFLIKYDYVASNNARGFNSTEILALLNNAQDDFIKQRMFGKNFQPPAFEQNQKRVADLRSLIYSANISSVTGGILGEVIYPLPLTSPIFLYYIDSYTSLIRSNYPVISSAKFIQNKFIEHTSIGKFTNSEINRTHFLNPIIYIEGSSIYVLADRFTTISANNSLKFIYLRKPAVIVNSTTVPDLPVHTHEEIVDIAVNSGLQIIGDPRWQTAMAQNQIKTE